MTSTTEPASLTRPIRDVIGVSAALATPFDEDGAIDWPVFSAHAVSLLDRGVAVVTAFGTTGEGVSLPRSERAALYDRFGEAGVPMSAIVECVYGPSSREAGDQMRRAFDQGVAGILLTPPFYFKEPSEDGVFRWYAEAIEATRGSARGIILYNIPGLTGVTIGPRLVARLRDAFPGVVGGVKDSSGDWSQTTALLAEHRDLAILVGHEGHLAAAVREGATGAISGIANVAPRLLARLVSGEDDPAIHAVLEQVLSLPVVPAVKALLAARTGEAGWLRVHAPLTPVGDPGALAAIARVAATLD